MFCLLLLSFLVSVCFLALFFSLYSYRSLNYIRLYLHTRSHVGYYSGTPIIYVTVLLLPACTCYAFRHPSVRAPVSRPRRSFLLLQPSKNVSDTFIAVLPQLFLLFSEPYRPTWTRQSSSPLCSSKSRLQASLSHFLPPLGYL